MSLTREALTASGASALVPKIIDPQLLEYQRRYSPLVRTIPSKKWNTDVFHFNRRDTYGVGGFITDGGARPVTNGSYTQNFFSMKHLQSVGDVTGYAEEVASVAGSLRGLEIEGAIQSLYWDLETALLWGNADATVNGPYPQFSGLDTLLATYSGATQNAIDAAGATLSLAYLDRLIDMVETNAAMPVQDTGFMFVCSPTAQSKVAQLLVAQQRFEQVEVVSGLNVMSYRGVPFVKSSFLSPRSIQMGTVTTATATTGGVLPLSSTYKYQVSAVIARSGETIASAEVTQATGAGTSTNTITLSFTPPTGLDSAGPILYKVYRTAAAGGTGTETLLGVVDSVVTLSGTTATPTTSIMDTGAALVPKNSSTTPDTVPTAYFTANTEQKPIASGSEHIYLINRDERNLVRPYVRELEPLEVYPTTSSPDSNPFALTCDTTFAVRAPRFLGGIRRIACTLA